MTTSFQNLNILLWGALAALILATALLLMLFHVYIRFRQQKREITLLKKRLKFTHEELLVLQQEEKEKIHFKATLSNASITTKLQGSRLMDREQVIPTVPEKYKVIASMLQNGMDAGEISSVLSIPENETRQLVKLASIGT